MSGYVTRQKYMATVKERIAERVLQNRKQTHTARPPAHMNSDAFWRDLRMLHVRAERFGTFRRPG
jgi:hypothetical protein